MSATLEITPERLIVHVEGADRLWALKSRLEVPIDHVTGAASATEEAHKWLHGMRVGGTHIPGVISAGRFYSHGQTVFWDVHEPEKAIGIELRDERYGHLVLEVENPQAEIARIEHVISGVPA